MKQQAEHLAWDSGIDAVNFYMPAVVAMPLEEWLAMAGQQYFAHLQPDERTQALTEVYRQCMQSTTTDAPEETTGKKQKNNARKGSDTNSEAPVNP